MAWRATRTQSCSSAPLGPNPLALHSLSTPMARVRLYF